MVVMAVLWIVVTADRTRVWQDERRLWAEAVRHAPAKPRPWANLGRQLALRGADGLAEWHFQTAVDLAAARPLGERATTLALIATNRERLQMDLTAWLLRTE